MNEFRRGAFFRELSLAGLRIAKAWEMLHQPEITRNMDTLSYVELCKDAGYSDEAAQRAGTRWANMRLDRGLGQ